MVLLLFLLLLVLVFSSMPLILKILQMILKILSFLNWIAFSLFIFAVFLLLEPFWLEAFLVKVSFSHQLLMIPHLILHFQNHHLMNFPFSFYESIHLLKNLKKTFYLPLLLTPTPRQLNHKHPFLAYLLLELLLLSLYFLQ